MGCWVGGKRLWINAVCLQHVLSLGGYVHRASIPRNRNPADEVQSLLGPRHPLWFAPPWRYTAPPARYMLRWGQHQAYMLRGCSGCLLVCEAQSRNMRETSYKHFDIRVFVCSAGRADMLFFCSRNRELEIITFGVRLLMLK